VEQPELEADHFHVMLRIRVSVVESSFPLYAFMVYMGKLSISPPE
jgi:hypothetical protein